MDLELPVARLPGGAWATMTISVIHGAKPGPTIWLSAAIHGDELNGVMIVQQLIKEVNPRELSGTVLAVPIVNMFGVANGSRYLPDRRDLNRSFPGSPKGSLAARLANMFFTNVASRCDVGLDFHTASNGRDNLPQIRCDLDHEETRGYASAFGAPLTLHATLRDGSLRAAARKRGVHVLLFEAGEANRLNPAVIESGVSGSLRVMYAMGMLNREPPKPSQPPLYSRKSRWIRAPRSGFCMVTAELGELIEIGNRVATVDDGFGSQNSKVTSRLAGMVIGVLRTAAVHRGDALLHVAEVQA